MVNDLSNIVKETSFSGLINRSNSDIKIMEDRSPCNSVCESKLELLLLQLNLKFAFRCLGLNLLSKTHRSRCNNVTKS